MRAEGQVSGEGYGRPPLAPQAPHQRRPARDAVDALECGGVVSGPGRVQEGASTPCTPSTRSTTAAATWTASSMATACGCRAVRAAR